MERNEELIKSWEGLESAPLEFFHSRMMDLFHEWRRENFHPENLRPECSGIDIDKLVAKAKIETYKKYPKQVSDKPILKTEL